MDDGKMYSKNGKQTNRRNCDGKLDNLIEARTGKLRAEANPLLQGAAVQDCWPRPDPEPEEGKEKGKGKWKGKSSDEGNVEGNEEENEESEEKKEEVVAPKRRQPRRKGQ